MAGHQLVKQMALLFERRLSRGAALKCELVVAVGRTLKFFLHVVGAPGAHSDWTWNNARQAVQEFVVNHLEFAVEEPPLRLHEGVTSRRVTDWPDAHLKKKINRKIDHYLRPWYSP
jgi:hypothetical protein